MKKTIISVSILAALSLLISCIKENVSSEVGVSYRFLAEVSADDTKCLVDSEIGKVLWAVEDSISILGSTYNSKFVSDNGQPSSSANFEGFLPDVKDAKFGLYPYNPNAVVSDNTVNVSLPKNQMATDNSFAPGLFISLAKVNPSSNVLSFTNLCGGIRFNLSKEGINEVTITANSNETLVGDVDVSFSISGKPYVKDVIEGGSTITLRNDEGFKTGVWYYIVTFPQKLTQGFTISMYTDSEFGVIEVNEMCEIKRSVFASLKDLSSKVSEWKHYSAVPEEFLNSNLCMIFHSDKQYYFPPTEFQYGFSYADNKTWFTSNLDNKALSVRIGTNPEVGKTVDVDIWAMGIDIPETVETMSIVKIGQDKIWLWSKEYGFGYVLNWEQYIPISSVDVDVDALSLYPGESTKLNCTILPKNATDCHIEWKSSNPSVAIVHENGEVYALSEGTATIEAITIEGIKSSCKVDVLKIPVEEVLLDNSQVDVPIGESIKLNYSIIPSNASDKRVKWEIVNNEIAKVDEQGVVTGLKVGTTKLVCISLDGERTAECQISVSPIDLSKNGTANCYVVSHFGNFSFNGTVQGHTSNSIGSPVSADVLWESFGTATSPSVGDIVTNVYYNDGRVHFTVPSPIRNGNAVIAVRGESGNILWSWHIWVCDGFYPEKCSHKYFNKYYSSNIVMMDRNLGATSATPGDVHALGLYYQWGRKDPFTGSASISEYVPVATCPQFPAPVESTSETGSNQYVIEHPMTYVTSKNRNDDWYYTGTQSVERTRWKQGKGVYDPCPSGWCVPDGNSWYYAFGFDYKSANLELVYDQEKKGVDFGAGHYFELGAAQHIWYPMSGHIVGRDGEFWDDASGSWWTSSVGLDDYGTYYHGYMLRIWLDEDIVIWPSRNLSSCCSDAYSVRCMRM